MGPFDEFLVSAGPLVQEDAERVAAKAAQLAPRDTGFTAAHIAAEMTLDGATPVARVGWTVETLVEMRKGSGIFRSVGELNEFGTVHMPPQPHLRPAVDLF